MKLTKSASLNAKNRIPEQPKNRNPHKTGWMFDRRERGKVAGFANADGFHSQLRSRKKRQR